MKVPPGTEGQMGIDLGAGEPIQIGPTKRKIRACPGCGARLKKAADHKRTCEAYRKVEAEAEVRKQKLSGLK